MQIQIILTSIVLGAMLFFSFVVAPIIFKVLNEKQARIFIRQIFPFYYLFNLSLLLIILFYLSYRTLINYDFYLIATTAFLFALSLFILMPRINDARDQKNEKKFKRLHATSVIINFVQIFFLFYVLV